FTRPSGYIFSPKDVGTNDAKDSDVDPFVGVTDPFSLVLKQHKTDLDAGMFQPSISISDAQVLEGNAGLTPAVFTLTMSQPSDVPVTVFYHTMDGSALEGSDYIGFP